MVLKGVIPEHVDVKFLKLAAQLELLNIRTTTARTPHFSIPQFKTTFHKFTNLIQVIFPV